MRFRFAIWHLLFLVAIAAGGLWYVLEYDKQSVTIVLDDYQVLERGQRSWMKIAWHYELPERLRHVSHNVFLARLPQELLRKDFQAGQQIKFRYRARSSWLLDREEPEVMLWNQLLNRTEYLRLNAIRDQLIEEQVQKMREGSMQLSGGGNWN